MDSALKNFLVARVEPGLGDVHQQASEEVHRVEGSGGEERKDETRAKV